MRWSWTYSMSKQTVKLRSVWKSLIEGLAWTPGELTRSYRSSAFSVKGISIEGEVRMQIQWLPITRTFKGNRKNFELLGVRSNKPEVSKWDWGGMQVSCPLHGKALNIAHLYWTDKRVETKNTRLFWNKLNVLDCISQLFFRLVTPLKHGSS